MANLLSAVILAGGESRRMGIPKAWINYHDSPEVVRLFHLTEPFCSKTGISIQAWPEDAPDLLHFSDAEAYANSGPIGGVLTAFDHFQTPLLVLGCDYPMISHDLLQYLVSARDQNKLATALLNTEGVPEPLIAIYELSGLEFLKQAHKQGYQSMKFFLQEQDCKMIPAPIAIKSIDTPTDRDFWLNS